MENKARTTHYGARVSAAITALLLLIFIGVIGFRHFEGWNWTKSFYFTVATLTTVGYGDLHPTTDASRLFTAIYILFGVGVALTALGIIGATYIDQRARHIVEREEEKPVLVDFWAVWCYPCKAQAPIIDEVANEMKDSLKVVKVEVDDSPNTAAKYNILSIPTLMLFKNGEIVWQGVGIHQKPVLIDELKKHLS